MLKNLLIVYLFLSGCSFAQDIDKKLNSLINMQQAISINEKELLSPYNYLLTQPLMTKGIEHYYQRKAFIKTIYAKKDKVRNRYSRIILMLLYKDKAKYYAKQETAVAELAFITMNFNELPESLSKEVQNTKIPFGKLLEIHHIKTTSQNRSYFSVKCNAVLSSLTHCKINEKIFGRRNTLIRIDNKHWVAKVIEILPGLILP